MSRILIADDEAPARRKLVRFAEAYGGLDVVAEASNGVDAVDLIGMTAPDIVFLDVHMPDLDGFGVAAAIARSQTPPIIVFVTAHDRYALQAFDANAVDYLLKPYDRSRFTRAVERALERLSHGSAASIPLERVVAQARNEAGYLKRLLVPHEGRSFFLPVSDILCVSSDGNAVEFETARGRFRMRTTMESLEGRLNPAQFVRIHRSHLVNIDAVAAIEPAFHGDRTAILRNGRRLTWSRRYATRRADLLA
ncbi:MAG: response regulator transcription factor [Candidatus Eremiobacteraeota bacterium]|nr:response regulator transcription factor [Candidatus Eremiobacteraeota bacterium]